MGQKKLVTKTDTPVEEAKVTATVGAPKKSSKRQVINGIANITVSYNNTMIVITDSKGEVLTWSSAGSLGFNGSKKSTPYAAGLVARNVMEKAKRFNLVNLKIAVKGVGPGRESAIRSLAAGGLNIIGLIDKTPVAHNGVKAKKPRRV